MSDAVAALARMEAELAAWKVRAVEWEKRARSAEAELAEANAKIDRLTARGIEDLKHSLAEAEVEVKQLREALETIHREACPFCGHLWKHHDPEDGMCDSHSSLSSSALTKQADAALAVPTKEPAS